MELPFATKLPIQDVAKALFVSLHNDFLPGWSHLRVV